MVMNTILIILLVWLIVFLHLVWLDIKPTDLIRNIGRKSKKTVTEEPIPTQTKEHDFMGKSLVRTSATKPVAAISQTVTAILEEGEEVDEKDVTFAPPKQDSGLRQMTPEEEEEAFKSFKYSKEEDAEETPAGNYAEGYTYEDMVEAMKVAKKPIATKSEEAKAGKVLDYLDGTELLNMLEKNQADFSKRVRSIIEKYKSQDGGNTASEEEFPNNGRKPFKLPENPTEFNIRDFV